MERVVTFFLVSVFGVGVMLMTGMSQGASAMSGQQSRPVVTVFCPADMPDADALCQAMIRSLGQVVPERVVRRGDVPKLQSDDLAVVLHVDDRRDAHLSGYLEWQDGSGARGTGPVVQLDVMDSGLRPAMFNQFTDGLLKAGPTFWDNTSH